MNASLFDHYRPKTSQETKDKIIRLREEGVMTLQQIAIECDVPGHTVSNVLFKYRKQKDQQ